MAQVLLYNTKRFTKIVWSFRCFFCNLKVRFDALRCCRIHTWAGTQRNQLLKLRWIPATTSTHRGHITSISCTASEVFCWSRWVDFEKASFWGSPLQRLTGIKPSLQNKRHRLKRKQRGAKRKLVHILVSGPDTVIDRASKPKGKNVAVRKRVIRHSQRPSFVCLTLTLAPPASTTHLSFHSHGSFSLIWIPTVFYITDGASITVKHMPFTEPAVRWCTVCV